MDIDLDESLIQEIVSHEYLRASADIAGSGPQRALSNSQVRHDERLSAAGDVGTLACKAGCYWCCYFTVDVRPAEVFGILDFMETHLAPAQQQRIRDEIAVNSVALRDLDDIERTRRNLRCPFLAEGRCTIYPVRPQTCRNYHATNVAGCQRTFEEPDNDDIDPEFAPLFYQTGGAHVDAFSQAMKDAGYDTDAYELNSALAVAMAEPDSARQRFESKQPSFDGLAGIEVPPEFVFADDVADK